VTLTLSANLKKLARGHMQLNNPYMFFIIIFSDLWDRNTSFFPFDVFFKDQKPQFEKYLYQIKEKTKWREKERWQLPCTTTKLLFSLGNSDGTVEALNLFNM
jgi:hypothetical protein